MGAMSHVSIALEPEALKAYEERAEALQRVGYDTEQENWSPAPDQSDSWAP